MIEELSFKAWFSSLEENGTSTGSVASFARPIGPMVRRAGDSYEQFPGNEKKKHHKKKKKKSH